MMGLGKPKHTKFEDASLSCCRNNKGNLVSHPILLAKLHALGLSDCAMNWIISYLKDRCQIIKCNGTLSSNEQINTGIVQGSGIGPMLYVVMDLHTLSLMNILVKYADDTNLLVPADTPGNSIISNTGLLKIKW